MASTTPTILVPIPTPVVLNPGNPRLGIWPQLFLPPLSGWTFGETVLSRTDTNDPVWLVWINFRYPDGSVRPVYQFPVPLPPSPPPNNTTTRTSASTPRSITNTAMASVHVGSRPSSSTARMAPPPPPPSGSRLAPRASASSSAVGHAPASASYGRNVTAPRTQAVTAAARIPVPRLPSGSRPISSSRRPSTPVASTSGSRVPTPAPTTPPRRKIAPLPRGKKDVPSTQRSGDRVPPLSPSGNTMAARETSSSKPPVGASSTHATVGEAENVPPSEPTTAHSSSPTRKQKEARDDVESATRPQLNHEDFNWYETGCLMLNGDLPVDYALFQGKLLDAQVEEFERDFIDYEAGDDTRAKQLAALQ